MSNVERKRCAVYTRKSCEEGLELEYNSLDAQYDAAVAYITSQASNGWTLIGKRYDDGGFSGGDMDRPALGELLRDVKAGLIDVVVVYKIDRLSRSVCDFADLTKLFDRHSVSFVSVTQQIDTSNASGRMMLNILMSFAQFEREMTADRIRDKIYASRKKGLWTGGTTPFGYMLVDKRLQPDPRTAPIAKYIFQRYAETGSAKLVAKELQAKFGPRPTDPRRGGDVAWRMVHVQRILQSVVYKGDVPHNRTGETFRGVHEALVAESLWEDCSRIRSERSGLQPGRHRETTATLKGLLRCGHCNCAMIPVFTNKKDNVRYSYYRCLAHDKVAGSDCPLRSVSGSVVERLVVDQLGAVLKRREFLRLVAEGVGISVAEAERSLSDIPSFFGALFPPERGRLLHCLVSGVTVRTDGVDIVFRTSGLEQLVKEMRNGDDD